MHTEQAIEGIVESDEINIGFTDEQVDSYLRFDHDKRFIVASAGPIVFDWCAEDLLQKKAKVKVLLLGIPVGEVVLDKNSVEQSIGPNIGIAKASITFNVDWDAKKVSFQAKGCVRNWRMKWKCADYDGTIARW